MTPIEFLARLCALIPPPFYPLVRYHGVLAPASPWRSRVVPISTGPRARQRAQLGPAAPPKLDAPMPPAPAPELESTASEPAPSSGHEPAVDARPPSALSAAALWASLVATRLSRYDWAQLLRRVFDVDALRCPRCDGRLAFVAVLTDVHQGAALAAILDHLGFPSEPSEPPRFARARDPTDDL